MKQILLIMIGLSTFICADFNRSTEGIVTDNSTTLQWQDNYSDNGGNIMNTSWVNAISYCESLNLDGDGWRLPNLNELNSLIDDTANYPAISNVFQNIFIGDYWSSTSYSKLYGNWAWYVSFHDGKQSIDMKSVGRTIRCVRGGK